MHEYIHTHHTIPSHTISYHTISPHTTAHHIIPYHPILDHYLIHLNLHCIALHCITLHYITLHDIVVHTHVCIYICVCVRDTCVWVYRYVQSTYTYAYNGVWMYPSQRTMLCRGDKRPDLAGFSPVLCCQSWQRPHVAERACEKYLNASSDQTGLSRLRKLKVWHVSVSARHPKTQSESRLNLPTLCQSENWNQHQIEQRLPKSQEVGMGT
jgi:hypothetical protein